MLQMYTAGETYGSLFYLWCSADGGATEFLNPDQVSGRSKTFFLSCSFSRNLKAQPMFEAIS